MNYTKELSIKKSQSNQEITPDQLRKINDFSLKDLKSEEIYTRRFLLAHNMIDRDNERFSEGILSDFAKTLPGKSLLLSHNRTDLGKGLFFDAKTEIMSPLDFESLTGEKTNLPEGISTVMTLLAWIYMLKMPANEEIIANIDGGIYRHVSIGFSAANIIPIKKDTNGPVLFWEYVAPGEALEGSLVWLGAQPGATVKGKSVKGSLVPDAVISAAVQLEDKEIRVCGILVPSEQDINKSEQKREARDKCKGLLVPEEDGGRS